MRISRESCSTSLGYIYYATLLDPIKVSISHLASSVLPSLLHTCRAYRPTHLLPSKVLLLGKRQCLCPAVASASDLPWHRSPADILVRQATPLGYTAVDLVRSADPNHGGIVIVFPCRLRLVAVAQAAVRYDVRESGHSTHGQRNTTRRH